MGDEESLFQGPWGTCHIWSTSCRSGDYSSSTIVATFVTKRNFLTSSDFVQLLYNPSALFPFSVFKWIYFPYQLESTPDYNLSLYLLFSRLCYISYQPYPIAMSSSTISSLKLMQPSRIDLPKKMPFKSLKRLLMRWESCPSSSSCQSLHLFLSPTLVTFQGKRYEICRSRAVFLVFW